MAFVVIALVVAILMAMAKDQARRYPAPRAGRNSPVVVAAVKEWLDYMKDRES